MPPAPSSEQRVQTVCLLILTAIGVGGALHWLSPVMVPFALAFFLAVVLTPVVEILHRRLKLPAVLGLFAALVLGVGIFAVLGMLVSQSVDELRANEMQYVAGIEELKRDVNHWAERLGFDPVIATGEERAADGSMVEATRDRAEAFPARLARELLPGTVNALVGVLSQGILVLIFMMFLVTGRAHSGTLGDVEQRIKGYVMTKLVVSGVTGVLVWGSLAALGVPMALVFGLFAFLLNFIPNVGSMVSTVLPLPLLLIGDFSITVVVLGLLVPGAIQFAVGNVLEPKMLGDSMNLHPVTILLALIFWGMIWGIVGTLLATPITAVLRVLLEKSNLMRPVALVMAGRLESDPPAP